ncbi:MAG: hypothetical protein KDK70_30075 [Myxococcales bacterium]|nr:hypothetical protein [Myxococcales bacterium]
MDDDRPCRYAAGLPHRGTRALPEPERRTLEQRLQRQAWRTGLVAGAVIAIMAAAIGLADRLPRLALLLHGGVGMGMVALGAVGVIACLLVGRQPWRSLALLGAGYLSCALAAEAWRPDLCPPRWLTAEVLVATTVLGLCTVGLSLARRVRLLRLAPRIRADLAQGTLECFEGPRVLDRALARLHPADRGEPRSLRIEVLPRSGLVVRAGEQPVDRWATVHVVDVAPAQPHALRVELPQGVAPAAPDPRLCLRRRSLTPHERAELARHVARLRRRWWPAVALTAVVLGLVAWDLRTTSPGERFPLDGASLGWLALLVVTYVGYGRRMLAARRLERDRKLRWVVTVHEDAADPRRDPPTLEVLPISQLAWTERASPAGWRLSRP